MPGAPHTELGAVGIDGVLQGGAGHLGPADVDASPVVGVGHEVVVLGEQRQPGAGDPQLEGPLAKLDGSLQVALVAAHAMAGAEAGHGRAEQLASTLPLCQLHGSRRHRERLVRLLSPRGGPAQGHQSLQLLRAFELGQELAEAFHRRLVFLQPHQREPVLQPDAFADCVVGGQFEGRLVERGHLFGGPRFERPLGGQEQVVEGPVCLAGLPPVMGEQPG
jgi:hypothetical protein